jgi:hypothetical protein
MKKSSLSNKEKLYVLASIIVLLVILLIIGSSLYNKLSTSSKGKIELNLKDSKIVSGEETRLFVIVKNTGSSLMEGTLFITADDVLAVNVSHEDPSVLNIKLYPGESVTRIFSVSGITNAIRTDYKLLATIKKGNETVSSNELILTVTKD